MENIEIFDKDGNALNLGDIIYSFIKDMAIKHKKEIEDVYIGLDNSKWNKHKGPSIYMVELKDNSYDAKYVFSFGDDDVLRINLP
jgi:hypothetical protein